RTTNCNSGSRKAQSSFRSRQFAHGTIEPQRSLRHVDEAFTRASFRRDVPQRSFSESENFEPSTHPWDELWFTSCLPRGFGARFTNGWNGLPPLEKRCVLLMFAM